MPIYEYRCECGCERELILPLQKSNELQTCECGDVMQRIFSLSNPQPLNSSLAFTKQGKSAKSADMALRTLNSNGRNQVGPEGRFTDSGLASATAGLNRTRPLEEKVFAGFSKGMR